MPDVSVFGKAMGNGYSISAIIGKREIMDHAQDSFMSSTFWTERTGSVAALETLKQMEKIKSWKIITKKGLIIQKKWIEISKRNNLKIQVQGIPALSSFIIKSNNWLKYKTFITQEMLKKGFLASNCVYVSVAHSEQVIASYFENLSGVFKLIKECENGRDILSVLDGPVCHSGFKRLN